MTYIGVSSNFMFTALLILLLICCSFDKVSGQKEIEVYDLGDKDRVAKIDILQLPLSGVQHSERGRWHLLNKSYFSEDAKNFFIDKRYSFNCRNKAIEPQFVCFEITNAEIGYFYDIAHQVERYPQLFITFYSHKNAIVEVFHNPDKDQYFLRVRYHRIYGPFKGDPLIELNKASLFEEKKGKFKNIKFKFVSKRWRFPDEKDAMVDRGNDYDFIGGRPSGRAIESIRLNSQFFKFRLENNSKKTLYLLETEFFFDDSYSSSIGLKRLSSQNNPMIFKEFFSKSEKRWQSTTGSMFIEYNSSSYVFGAPYWKEFPEKSALEFEINTSCFKPTKKCRIGVYLNDKPSFRNMRTLTANFKSHKRRKFSKENEPPPNPWKLRMLK